MIYTVTLNPSLDYIVSVDHFALGRTNRTSSELMLPGGKGLNVSMVLKNLGVDSTALGFAAGFVGRELIRQIREMGITNGLIEMDHGVSRINVKLKNEEGTEINGMGPSITDRELELLMEQLGRMSSGDMLVLAGSIPASMPSDMYSRICRRYADAGISMVVDATGELLQNVLQYHPFLIKPNNHELGELFGVRLERREDVVPYARKLQEQGARNVLVSMAGEGAVLVSEDGRVFQCAAPKGELKNGVGAGDSMVAGFITGWLERKDYQHAFAMGVAAGSASAFSEYLATKPEVSEVLERVEVLEIK